MKWTPHAYQREAIQFVIRQATSGLLLDPGLGKTSIMLSAFSLLKKKGINRRMLVVAPLRPAQSTWPAEVQKWDHLSGLRMQVLWGPKKDDLLANDSDVDVINPEGLEWLARRVVKIYKEWPWDVLCVDESTRFKHPSTQRFLTLRPMLRMFKRRYILTGSPAPNGLTDLWGQIYLLDQGNALGPGIGWYRTKFFDQVGWGTGYTPKSGAPDDIYKRLKPLVLRMDARDLLELPPLVENIVRVDLPAEAMHKYDQMENILLTEVEQRVISAANASVAWGKCRQIANGGLFHEGGKEWSHIHEAKVEAICELVEELQGKPALVAYEYRHDLDRLRCKLGDVPHIGGGVPAATFRQIEADWNAGRIPVLLAQPQSVAHGLNLQGTGAAVIFGGLTPDLEVDEQFIRRVWRQGQKERVVVHRIVARNTVDEVIVKMIHSKDKTQRALLDALKDHLKEGKRRRAA